MHSWIFRNRERLAVTYQQRPAWLQPARRPAPARRAS